MTEKILIFIILAPIILGTLGIIMVASASSSEIIGYSVISSKFLKQFLIFIICLPFYLFIIKIRTNIWIKLRYFLLGLSILSLMAVHFFGVSINNSTRWLKIYNFTFQPTYFSHLALVIFISGEKKLIICLFASLLTSLLLFLQPDISSAFITIIIAITMLFVKGFKTPKIIYFIFLVLLVSLFFPKQMNKFVFRSRLFYSNNFQMTINSMRKGKFLGMGLGEGIDKFSTIPLPYSDNIFITGAQELGFVWGILVIMIFLLYYLSSFYITSKVSLSETKLLCFGTSTLIVLYALLNIFSSLNIIPSTGDPLPFISLGGSSLITFYICAGIIGGIANESSNSRWWNRRTYNTSY